MTSEESQLISDFLNGRLSTIQIKEVENRMENDAAFKGQVLIERQLFETLNPDDWSFVKQVSSKKIDAYKTLYNSETTKKFKANLNTINQEYQGTQKTQNSYLTSKINWKIYVTAAAVLLVVFSLLFLLPNTKTPQQLYAESLNLSELPSITVRGEIGSKNSLTKAQNAFESGAYKDALELLSSEEHAFKKRRGILLLYKGISHMELENYDEALKNFNTLSSSNLIDAPKGIWYKALLFLKKGDTNMVRESLNVIILDPNHYKYTEAKKILEQLQD